MMLNASPSNMGPTSAVTESADGALSAGRLCSPALLNELLKARGPHGQEDEVATICQRELLRYCDQVKTDHSGNVIGTIRGSVSTLAPLYILAHMDELSLIVKRIEDDGSLVVKPLGGMQPANFGQGPVEIISEDGILPGAMSFGSMHVSAESKAWEIKAIGGNKAVDWSHVSIITRVSKKELIAAGVGAGSRVVVASSRRGVQEIGDCFGGFFMDNRALVFSMLECAARLRVQNTTPPMDIHFCATTLEEFMGAPGASFLLKDAAESAVAIALDVIPVAKEYDVSLTADPVVVFADRAAIYDRKLSQRLRQVATQEGIATQSAVLESYSSDASQAKMLGHIARAGLLGIPTLNTHGYELIHKDSMGRLSALLSRFAMMGLHEQ